MNIIKNIWKLLILLCTCTGFSQNVTNTWSFGKMGLNFATTPPTVLSDGGVSADEGCTSISDNAGNLLFYSNGETVYNKSHSIMSNGNGLSGSASTSQSSLIVKKKREQ